METEIRSGYRMWVVTVYLFLVSAFLYLKPAVAFGEEGRIRPFGTGDRQKTVFPLWWWMFVLAVVAYVIVLFLIKFRF
jgi:hypothetical protein